MDPLKLFELICQSSKDSYPSYSLHQSYQGYEIKEAVPSNHNDYVSTFATGSTAAEAITNAAVKLKIIEQPFPPYVWLGDTALRLKGSVYYRDAGAWMVSASRVQGVLLVVADGILAHAHGKELVPCTEAEWREDNKGCV